MSIENFDEKKRESAHRDGKKGGENDKREDGLSKRQAVTQDGQRDSRPAGERRAPGPSDQKTGNRDQHREDPQRQRPGQGRRLAEGEINRTGRAIVYCKERVTKQLTGRQYIVNRNEQGTVTQHRTLDHRNEKTYIQGAQTGQVC